jgi:hypothetical protein
MVERKLVVQWSGLKFGAVSSIVSLPYLRLTACSELSCLGIFTELNLDHQILRLPCRGEGLLAVVELGLQSLTSCLGVACAQQGLVLVSRNEALVPRNGMVLAFY